MLALSDSPVFSHFLCVRTTVVHSIAVLYVCRAQGKNLNLTNNTFACL